MQGHPSIMYKNYLRKKCHMKIPAELTSRSSTYNESTLRSEVVDTNYIIPLFIGLCGDGRRKEMDDIFMKILLDI